MLQSSTYIAPEIRSEEKATELPASIKDYSDILKAYDITYTPNDIYWQIGEIKQVQGWIIHLSAIMQDTFELLTRAVLFLNSTGVPFKIIQTALIAEYLLDGRYGTEQIGKIISIYPADALTALELAKKLLILTIGLEGPSVPTDLSLGGIVYTRYGSFNPVLVIGPGGIPIKHIHAASGELTPDPYSIPFLLPHGIDWPFHELAAPLVSRPPKLLNNTYYHLSTLKKDIKGNVTKVLYFKGFLKVQSCIIKQGRRYIFSDENGRDMRDRLKWQYELSQRLCGTVPIPRILERFDVGKDSYLAMEFIKGISFGLWIDKAYRYRSWLDLPDDLQLSILDRLSEILRIVECLHKEGVIHRDLTPENFIIDKRRSLHLIDVELAWSSKDEYPSPPFRLGTPGFISPEQFDVARPTDKEDIYALGAFMIFSFTNLPPQKFFSLPLCLLHENLLFFLQDETLASLIVNCVQEDSAKRPTLNEIQDKLTVYRTIRENNITHNSVNEAKYYQNNEKIRSSIQAGIRGLSNSGLTTSQQLWLSFKKTAFKDRDKGHNKVVYEGWHTGVCGPLWFISLAKKMGFEIDACHATCAENWNYIDRQVFKTPHVQDYSLYYGAAGVAMALSEAFQNDLLDLDDKRYWEICFAKNSEQLSLSEGIAGQGIALLNSLPCLDEGYVRHLLGVYVKQLLNRQNSDGSWTLNKPKGPKNYKLFGLSDGNAGIIWFLLAYIRLNPSQNVQDEVTSAKRGLDWLINKSIKKGNEYIWPSLKKGKSINQWSSATGIPGITLLFIKAYEVLRIDTCRKIAEANLLALPIHPVRYNFSLAEGLAGIGEIYLEAFKVFGVHRWQNRALWIAQMFLHSSFGPSADEKHWIIESNSSPTADLFTGNTGVMHFLMHYLHPNDIEHPLWPSFPNFKK